MLHSPRQSDSRIYANETPGRFPGVQPLGQLRPLSGVGRIRNQSLPSVYNSCKQLAKSLPLHLHRRPCYVGVRNVSVPGP